MIGGNINCADDIRRRARRLDLAGKSNEGNGPTICSIRASVRTSIAEKTPIEIPQNSRRVGGGVAVGNPKLFILIHPFRYPYTPIVCSAMHS